MNHSMLKISENPRLFDDYINEVPSAISFYPHYYKSDITEILNAKKGVDYSRSILADVLENQNKAWDAPETVLKNIEKLRSTNTFAVVTGQQAGVLGGPLYTFYKIITTIKLSQQLNEKHPSENFIPIFWLEVNDSDFAEISFIKFLAKNGNLQKLSLPEESEDFGKTVASRAVHPTISEWKSIFDDAFFDSEFKAEAIQTFLSSYQNSTNYTDAFAKLLMQFFGKHGVVFINPAEERISKLAKPMFQKALLNASEIIQKFTERSSQIQGAHYPTQIQSRDNQTMLFYKDEDNHRYRIDFEDDAFKIKYPDGYRTVYPKYLIAEHNERPSCLLPNVALRPLMQDTVLPTVAYIGGPSEVAYFAQIAPLYDYFNITMPAIVPRHRVTIIEGKVQKLIEKNQLSAEKLFPFQSDFIQKYIAENGDQSLYKVLEETETQISQSLQELEAQSKAFDPELEKPISKTRANIEKSLNNINGRITRSLAQKNQTQIQQLERLLANIFPDKNYQERVINMLCFCVKYGVDFPDRILESLSDDVDKHHLINL